jgi:hypothetical protein
MVRTANDVFASLANLILPHSCEFHKLRGHFCDKISLSARTSMPFSKSVFNARLPKPPLLVLLLLLGMNLTGCRAFRGDAADSGVAVSVPNPLTVPLMDRWFVMDQVSDELDNYFRIFREERIRVVDSVMTEGWIETHPKIGGTILEPWKRDSTRGFERLHATLQTVRRFAKVRVIPTGNSYQIDVKVYKELEDLPQPIGSAVGGQYIRTDNTLDVDRRDAAPEKVHAGWIPMGRDFSLEQQILQNIQQRLAQAVE